jgi:hypothetical protein
MQNAVQKPAGELSAPPAASATSWHLRWTLLRAQLVLGMVVGTLTLIGLFFFETAWLFSGLCKRFSEMVLRWARFLVLIMAIVMLAYRPDKILGVLLLAVRYRC